jgi:hypothetical protein
MLGPDFAACSAQGASKPILNQSVRQVSDLSMCVLLTW